MTTANTVFRSQDDGSSTRPISPGVKSVSGWAARWAITSGRRARRRLPPIRGRSDVGVPTRRRESARDGSMNQ